MPSAPYRSLALAGLLMVGVTALLPGLRRSSAQEPEVAPYSVAAPGAAHGAGALIIHHVTITNSDEIPMLFTFDVEGGDWEVDAPESIGLDGLTTEIVEIPVRVPHGVDDAETDRATLTVSGRSDGPSIKRVLSLTSWTGGRYSADAFTSCRFDLNGDGEVDETDVTTVRDAFGARSGSESYDPMIDMNHDGRIGASDVQTVAGNRRTCGHTNTYDTGDIEEAVTADGIKRHLLSLQEIADANDGNRAFNTPGYDASVAYVAGLLEAAGFTVTTPEFVRVQSTDATPPELERITAEGAVPWPATDVRSFGGSGNGDVTALVQAVDLMLPPGPDRDASTSGCETADFADFETGKIALIQRGSCQFGVKATNAIAAGAVAVMIFNEGQTGRTAAFSSNVGATKPVPVVATSFGIGEEIAGLLAGGEDVTVRVKVDRGTTEIVSHNVIAEWPYGDPSRVIMTGSHLDSVPAGPGINDNGTGSSTLLEIGLQIAAMDLRPVNRIRFGWWGAEELGLVGSRAWVAQQEQGELDRIVAYFNYDMVGSPNWIRGVYDGDGPEFPVGSGEIEATHRRYLDDRELVHVPTVIGGRSDHAGFIAGGIPAGGLFTGAESAKTAEQFALFGGEEGVSLDPCYHRVCDTIDNIAFDVLDEMSDTMAHVLTSYANDPVFGLLALGETSRPGAEVLAKRLEILSRNPLGIGSATFGSPKGSAQITPVIVPDLDAGATTDEPHAHDHGSVEVDR